MASIPGDGAVVDQAGSLENRCDLAESTFLGKGFREHGQDTNEISLDVQNNFVVWKETERR
jgi:hypothetical protein